MVTPATILERDILISFITDRLVAARCRFLRNDGAGAPVRLKPVPRHRHQRVQIVFAILQQAHGLLIHHLLPRELNPAQHPRQIAG